MERNDLTESEKVVANQEPRLSELQPCPRQRRHLQAWKSRLIKNVSRTSGQGGLILQARGRPRERGAPSLTVELAGSPEEALGVVGTQVDAAARAVATPQDAGGALHAGARGNQRRAN